MSLLPRNSTPFELGMEAGVNAAPLPVPLATLWDPETCPESLLPWLAWALSVDEWDAGWPVAIKRQVCANSIDVHRHKGTLSAVRRAVAALGGSISIREWWETTPPGTPGTFSLILALADINGAAPSADYVDGVIRQVNQAKPVSRPFDFTLAIAAAGAIGLVGKARPLVSARLDMAA